MEIKEIKWKGMTITMSEGGCSIIGDGWDLTMPSKKFDRLVVKNGLDKAIIKAEMIKYYKRFFKITKI